MSIPKLLQDLAVIQKLSDLPNSTDGLSAAELKAKFDEAALAVQAYINNKLIPALTAAQIPFSPTTEVSASNIQDAVAAVQAQIRDAVSGTLVNGSVTKEKLASELLERVFGGRPWVSMAEPGSADNVDAEFPVGQIWLRPAFTVVNAASGSWTGNGCSVTDGVVTGDKSAAVATCSQALANLGREGDRVLVLFGIENRNAEVSGITVSLNGEGAQDAEAGVFETTLAANGALTVKLTTTWNSASLASDGWTMANYTVVNPDLAARQVPGAKEPEDWAAFVRGLQPFESCSIPAALFIQTVSGLWWPMMMGAEIEGGYLRAVDGRPVWTDRAAAAADLGVPTVVSGSYTGTGAAGTITLPVVPKLLTIAPASGIFAGSSSSIFFDNPVTLIDGAEAAEGVYDDIGDTVSHRAYVSLNGNTLEFSAINTSLKPLLMNRAGVVYNWTAIC